MALIFQANAFLQTNKTPIQLTHVRVNFRFPFSMRAIAVSVRNLVHKRQIQHARVTKQSDPFDRVQDLLSRFLIRLRRKP